MESYINTSTGTNELQIKTMGMLQSALKSAEFVAGYGAFGCFAQESSFDLFTKDVADKDISEEDLNSKMEKIFHETSGRGHGAVLDQLDFAFSLNNVPRSVTLFLCQFQYLEHLQQSLRRASADRGFYIPDTINEKSKNETVIDSCPNQTPALESFRIQKEAFTLYGKMIEGGVPTEDARYILPLNTLTSIQSKGNAREWMNAHYSSTNNPVPGIVTDIMNGIIDLTKDFAPRAMKNRDNNYIVQAWYPATQLYAEENTLVDSITKKSNKDVSLIDKSFIGNGIDDTRKRQFIEKAFKGDQASLSVLKHIHFTYHVEMSLSSFHQAIRQRTWDISCESVYSALDRFSIVVPPSIERSVFADDYNKMCSNMCNNIWELRESGIPKEDAIGGVPHALSIGFLIHMNAWNSMHSLAKRTCEKAQWELRGCAEAMAEHLKNVDPILAEFVGPQCKVYGKCPEAKPCGNPKF